MLKEGTSYGTSEYTRQNLKLAIKKYTKAYFIRAFKSIVLTIMCVHIALPNKHVFQNLTAV